MALSRLFKEDRLVIRENQSFRYLCLVISLSVCLSLSETKLTANVLKKIFFSKERMQCNVQVHIPGDGTVYYIVPF